jgi:FMN phosphatase YigB (HAD superfamily)
MERDSSLTKKTIIFDVDGTLFEYHGWYGVDHYGSPIEANITLCNALYDTDQYEICVWSTRTNPLVQGYPQADLIKGLELRLKEAGVKYHRILTEPKPLFYAMIDDKVINPEITPITILHASTIGSFMVLDVGEDSTYIYNP